MAEWHRSSSALSARVLPEHFEGAWSVSDDGWLGRLVLARAGANAFEGTLFSERFRQSYRVTAGVGATAHTLELVVHEYNFLPEQRYTSHLFTRGRNTFAGASKWRGVPFGFVAWRRDTPISGQFRTGPVEPVDFSGVWGMRLDGHSANMVLEYHGETGSLRGECWGRSLGPTYAVEGRPDPEVPHQVALVLSGPDADADIHLDGLLFSRPKNIVCGSAGIGGGRLGFYMVRCR